MSFSDTLPNRWPSRLASAHKLREVESDFIGIVREMAVMTYSQDDVSSHYIGSTTAKSIEILGHPANESNGGGGFSRQQAINAALGESVERYSAAYLDEDRVITASWNDLPGPAPAPEELRPFSEHQYKSLDFPFTALEKEHSIQWIDGVSLHSGETTWLPKDMILLNGHREPDQPQIARSTSNGLACGADFSDAMITGLLELLERDALMITWHAQLSHPILDLSGDDALEEACKNHFDRTGLSYTAVDMSRILGIPTVLGVVRNHNSDVGALALGAASRPTLAEAALEALLEAFQTRKWCKAMQDYTDPIPKDFEGHQEQVKSLDDHVRYYAERDAAQLCDFLTESKETHTVSSVSPLPTENPRVLLDAILERLPEDVHLYAVDVTPPDIDDLGLKAVKVFSPQLQPLDVGWEQRSLGNDRLYKVPKRLGYVNTVLTADDLNRYPHPFP